MKDWRSITGSVGRASRAVAALAIAIMAASSAARAQAFEELRQRIEPPDLSMHLSAGTFGPIVVLQDDGVAVQTISSIAHDEHAELERLRHEVEQAPESGVAHARLGRRLLAYQMKSEAWRHLTHGERVLREQLAHEPGDAALWLEYEKCIDSLGRQTEAREIVERLGIEHPKSSDVHIALADERSARSQEALASFRFEDGRRLQQQYLLELEAALTCMTRDQERAVRDDVETSLRDACWFELVDSLVLHSSPRPDDLAAYTDLGRRNARARLRVERDDPHAVAAASRCYASWLLVDLLVKSRRELLERFYRDGAETTVDESAWLPGFRRLLRTCMEDRAPGDLDAQPLEMPESFPQLLAYFERAKHSRAAFSAGLSDADRVELNELHVALDGVRRSEPRDLDAFVATALLATIEGVDATPLFDSFATDIAPTVDWPSLGFTTLGELMIVMLVNQQYGLCFDVLGQLLSRTDAYKDARELFPLMAWQGEHDAHEAALLASTKNTKRWTTHLVRSQLYWKRDEIEESENTLRRAFTQAPDVAAIRCRLGLLMLRSGGDVEEAAKLFTSALELDPRTARAHVGLALVALHDGQPDAAVEHARDATLIAPKSAALALWEGRILRAVLLDAIRARGSAPAPLWSDAFAAYASVVEHTPESGAFANPELGLAEFTQESAETIRELGALLSEDVVAHWTASEVRSAVHALLVVPELPSDSAQDVRERWQRIAALAERATRDARAEPQDFRNLAMVRVRAGSDTESGYGAATEAIDRSIALARGLDANDYLTSCRMRGLDQRIPEAIESLQRALAADEKRRAQMSWNDPRVTAIAAQGLSLTYALADKAHSAEDLASEDQLVRLERRVLETLVEARPRPEHVIALAHLLLRKGPPDVHDPKRALELLEDERARTWFADVWLRSLLVWARLQNGDWPGALADAVWLIDGEKPCANWSGADPADVSAKTFDVLGELDRAAHADPGCKHCGDVDALLVRFCGSNARREFELAVRLDNGLAFPNDHDRAAQWCRTAALHGDPRAQYQLSLMLYAASLPEGDDEAACWMMSAVDAGYLEAQQRVATVYSRRIVQDPDVDERTVRFTLDLLSKLYEKGDGRAACTIAVLYHMGAGVEIDAERARRWFARAADLDDIDALRALAEMCERGEGGDADPGTAARARARAAELEQRAEH